MSDGGYGAGYSAGYSDGANSGSGGEGYSMNLSPEGWRAHKRYVRSESIKLAVTYLVILGIIGGCLCWFIVDSVAR
jgi:hypothetical protein